MRTLLALIGSCAVTAHAQVLEASADWNIGPDANGHRYELYSFPGRINWGEAHTFAQSIGGNLATVASAAENEFIYTDLGLGGNDNVWHIDGFGSNIGPWLGGHQPAGSPEPAGGWQWVTGEPWGYTNWAPGEPNNFNAGENRIHFFGNPSRTSRWNDIPMGNLNFGVVVEIGPCNEADLAPPLGLLDLTDVTNFINAFIAGEPIADLNQDGFHDLSDVNRFVTAFLVGCP